MIVSHCGECVVNTPTSFNNYPIEVAVFGQSIYWCLFIGAYFFVYRQ